MEHIENDTKLIIQAVNGEKEIIDSFSLSSGGTFLLQIQVSGAIQGFDEVEIGIYSQNNLPLCPLGQLVVNRIPKSNFLMSDDLITMGVCAPGRESSFGHTTFFTEDNASPDIHLNFQVTSEFWKDNYGDLKEDQLLCMLTGIDSWGDNKTFMRGVPVLTLTP